MVDQEYLEALYGPLATRSEHQVGDRIRYWHEGKATTGTIIWICVPWPESDPPLRLCYVVQGDASLAPGFVFPADVLSA